MGPWLTLPRGLTDEPVCCFDSVTVWVLFNEMYNKPLVWRLGGGPWPSSPSVPDLVPRTPPRCPPLFVLRWFRREGETPCSDRVACSRCRRPLHRSNCGDGVRCGGSSCRCGVGSSVVLLSQTEARSVEFKNTILSEKPHLFDGLKLLIIMYNFYLWFQANAFC